MAFFLFEFFKNLFNGLKKAWNKLSDEQQDALKNGTGLIAIINANLELAPAALRQKIQEAYPNLPVAVIEAGMFSVAKTFGITGLSSLDDAINVVQAYLQEKEGKEWAVASHTAALALSVLFAPKETKVAQLVALIEFAYQKFIKNRKDDGSN